jgi:hypothetical protein
MPPNWHGSISGCAACANRIGTIFKYELLNQPELFYVFLEHLYHLGLVEYTNDSPRITPEYRIVNSRFGYNLGFFFIKLSHFGRLFHKACISA